MKVFGLTINFARRAPTEAVEKDLTPVRPTNSGGWRRILEPFAGAWSRNLEERRGDLLTYPTLYACIFRIESDIGKLPFVLKQVVDGIAQAVENSAYSPVLRKPNDYQTPGQFREQWMISKLTQGNTYVLKRRDGANRVNALYVLDPERVLPMVTDAGEVFYQLQTDNLNKLPPTPSARLIVPASEIIHDRCMTLHHPLVGVPPVAAAYWPVVKNMKIMRNATEFFANSAQPGGILTAPAGMSETDAQEVKDYWATNFTGGNAGRVAVIGADMKFTPFAMKSIDAQMIEQMKYGDQQICQPFGVPTFLAGVGDFPSGLDVEGVYQLYYNGALQTHIEHMEALLNEGLGVAPPLFVELDLDPLLRMNESKRADVAVKLAGGGVETPNEARLRFGHGPLVGGDTVYMQQQDFPLDQVRLNKIAPPPPEPAPAPPPESAEEDEEPTDEVARALFMYGLVKELEAANAD